MTDIADLIARLTLAEKCTLLAGDAPFTVPGCERLGIPGWRLSDGPVGVRGTSMGEGMVLPSSSAIAATWDLDLVEQLGGVLGEESIDRRTDVLLGPAINLHRSPRGGRHFEYFSEDPELSARLAVAYIRGLQATGVAGCAKHLVANEQEHERTTIDTIVDERTLREVYLRPFEAAVVDGDVRTVMAAYNYVNGHHACSHPEVLVSILRVEWGFDGLVISDWGAMKDTVLTATTGLDVEMPGPGRWWGDGRLQEAVETGAIDEAQIDEKVANVLRLLDWLGRLPGETADGEERAVEREEHRVLVRRAAADATVLLKNDEALLPLRPGARLAVVGPGAADTALFGGGSASLTPYRTTNVLDALRSRWDGEIVHEVGVDIRRAAATIPNEWLPDGIDVALYATPDDTEPIHRDHVDGLIYVWHDETVGLSTSPVARVRFTVVPDQTGTARVMASGFGIVTLAIDGEPVVDNRIDPFSSRLGFTGDTTLFEFEAGTAYEFTVETRPHDDPGMPLVLLDVGVEMLEYVDPEAAVVAAERAAASADVAVVVVGTSAHWEAEARDRTELSLPLDQDDLVRRVLAANPNTVVVLNCGGPQLLPWLDDVPAALLAWYPGQEGGEAIVDVLLGESEPAGRMPTTWAKAEADTPSHGHYPGDAGVVRYGEERLVGHRWYDAHAIEPAIPFGHGGSYTTFTWSAPRLTGSGPDVVLEVDVANAGERPGAEVVQVYVEPLDPPVDRPLRHLAGFAKVRTDAGASATARIELGEVAFRRWDVDSGGWVVDAGDYDLVVAASAVDLRDRIRHQI